MWSWTGTRSAPSWLATVLAALALVALSALLAVPASAQQPSEGAAADGSGRASAAPRPTPCGKGFPTPPPKRYRFRIAGTTSGATFWLDGSRETYLYRGEMKRVICRGTKVEYWQTSGTVTQTFTDIPLYPFECEFTGENPQYALGNARQTRPLRRFEVDVGFEWIGNKYRASVINPRRGNAVANGTARCPGPPAANGATLPVTFRHVSTDLFTLRGLPRRVVKGRIVNYVDPLNTYHYSFQWKLTAIT